MNKFNFIVDEDFRKILNSDYEEMLLCLDKKATKAVLILAESIIEAIIIDNLIGLEKDESLKDKYLKYDLNLGIQKSFELGIISEKTKNLSDVIRNYRNLIHPGKSIRLKENPTIDDSLIAKSLVEIIINEVSFKKQETYGYTADQILLKVEKDYTSEFIWNHLINKLNNYEKEKLLLKNLPQRYFAILSEMMETGDRTEERLFDVFSKFFMKVYSTTTDTIKKRVANNFITILSEGSDTEVIQNINSFFNTDFLRFYETADLKMVKQHLLSSLDNGVYEKIRNAMSGISNYLSDNELKEFTNILARKVTYPKFVKEDELSTSFLSSEYSSLIELKKDIVKKEIESRKSYASDATIKKLNELIEYIDDDLPF